MKKKIAFLVPSNEKCGIHDYSIKMFNYIDKGSTKNHFKTDLIKYKCSNNYLYYFNLAKDLSKKYDLIHVQQEFALFGKFGIGFFFFLLGIKKPLVITMHEPHPEGLLGVKENFLLLMKNKISKVLVLCNYSEKQALCFFPKEKIIQTGFGVDALKPSAVKEEKLVVHLGFIRPNKNQLFTAHLAKLLPEYKFIFAGSGEGKYYEEVKKFSADLKNVKITGFLSEKEFFRTVSRAESVIMPYTCIVQSAAFFDAVALKKNIICSEIPFFKEMESFGLCKCASLDNSFARKLKTEFSQKDKERMANYIKKNSFDIIAGKNIGVYEGILNGEA